MEDNRNENVHLCLNLPFFASFFPLYAQQPDAEDGFTTLILN